MPNIINNIDEATQNVLSEEYMYMHCTASNALLLLPLTDLTLYTSCLELIYKHRISPLSGEVLCAITGLSTNSSTVGFAKVAPDSCEVVEDSSTKVPISRYINQYGETSISSKNATINSYDKLISEIDLALADRLNSLNILVSRILSAKQVGILESDGNALLNPEDLEKYTSSINCLLQKDLNLSNLAFLFYKWICIGKVDVLSNLNSAKWFCKELEQYLDEHPLPLDLCTLSDQEQKAHAQNMIKSLSTKYPNISRELIIRKNEYNEQSATKRIITSWWQSLSNRNIFLTIVLAPIVVCVLLFVILGDIFSAANKAIFDKSVELNDFITAEDIFEKDSMVALFDKLNDKCEYPPACFIYNTSCNGGRIDVHKLNPSESKAFGAMFRGKIDFKRRRVEFLLDLLHGKVGTKLPDHLLEKANSPTFPISLFLTKAYDNIMYKVCMEYRTKQNLTLGKEIRHVGVNPENYAEMRNFLNVNGLLAKVSIININTLKPFKSVPEQEITFMYNKLISTSKSNPNDYSQEKHKSPSLTPKH